MSEAVRICRVRAEACEHNARTALDAILRKEWEELAIQWRLMASMAARLSGEETGVRLH